MFSQINELFFIRAKFEGGHNLGQNPMIVSTNATPLHFAAALKLALRCEMIDEHRQLVRSYAVSVWPLILIVKHSICFALL